MNRFLSFVLLVACLTGVLPHAFAVPLAVHHTNFYLLQDGDTIIYPQGVNASLLLRESVTPAQRRAQIERWKEAGANMLRVVVDQAIEEVEPLETLEQSDGRIQESVIQRIDQIIDIAEANEMWVVLVLFDLERISENWPQSRYHRSLGGSCESFMDFYQSGDMHERALARVEQLVKRYQGRNIAAFELARGINAWERFVVEEPEIRDQARLWTVLVSDQIEVSNTQNHLTALSYLPNTFDLTQIGLADIIFVSFRSGTAKALLGSIPLFLDYAQDYTKPMYISEMVWTGEPSQRDSMLSNVFWLSISQVSSMFLAPEPGRASAQISGADLSLLRDAGRFIPLLELEGTPRPQSSAPIQVANAQEYQLEETIVGSDRLFWVRRRSPVDGKTALRFSTVEGRYTYQWFLPESSRIGPSTQFVLTRRSLDLETPEFHEQIWGVLRLDQRPDERFLREYNIQPPQ